MTDTPEKLVCVGGEADGQRIVVDPSSKWIRVVNPIKEITPHWVIGSSPIAPMSISYTIYERSQWRAEDTIMYVLVPQGQSPSETLRLLIERYTR
jgi:hypothetical protein